MQVFFQETSLKFEWYACSNNKNENLVNIRKSYILEGLLKNKVFEKGPPSNFVKNFSFTSFILWNFYQN